MSFFKNRSNEQTDDLNKMFMFNPSFDDIGNNRANNNTVKSDNYSENDSEQNRQNKIYVEPGNKYSTLIWVTVLVTLFILFGMCLLTIISEAVGMIFPIFFFSIVIIAGLMSIFVPIISRINVKRRCKIQIIAKVVEIKTSRRSDSGFKKRNVGILYIPVYEYSYNGMQYVIRSGSYAEISKAPKIGDEIVGFINEENPKDFYLVNQKYNMDFFIFGFAGIAMSIVAMLSIYC